MKSPALICTGLSLVLLPVAEAGHRVTHQDSPFSPGLFFMCVNLSPYYCHDLRLKDF